MPQGEAPVIKSRDLRAQKVHKNWTIHSEIDKNTSHCNSRIFDLRENVPSRTVQFVEHSIRRTRFNLASMV